MLMGFDLDNTITKKNPVLFNPSIKMPWWLFLFIFPILMVIKPEKKIVCFMEALKKAGNGIVIISARPPQVLKATEKYLLRHNVPYDGLLCVGFGKGTKYRKLRAIRIMGVERFFDDDRRIVLYLKEHSVSAEKIPSFD